MKVFGLILCFILLGSSIGCKKVDELINGKDEIEVQYPGPGEVNPPQNEE